VKDRSKNQQQTGWVKGGWWKQGLADVFKGGKGGHPWRKKNAKKINVEKRKGRG